MDKDYYFSQFEIKTIFPVNKNTEICKVKMILHTKLSPYPKYCACKIVKILTKEDENEANIMKDFCTQNHPGFIKYYHHLLLDKLYIFLEDCYSYHSGFDDISVIKTSKKSSKCLNAHPFLQNLFFFKTQTINIMSAVKYLHERGLIHSDIAPKNIFLTKKSDFVLADFGSAVERNKYIKSFSINYLSPANYQKVSQGSFIIAQDSMDYFALGKSFYEMIILENQIPMSGFSGIIRFKQYVKKGLSNALKTGESFYKEIEKVIDGNFDNQNDKIFESVRTSQNIKTSQNFRTLNLKTYCSGCGVVGYSIEIKNSEPYEEILKIFQDSGGTAVGKLLMLRCKHEYHIACLIKKAKEKKTYPPYCPECLSFIGTRALTLLRDHPESKSFMNKK